MPIQQARTRREFLYRMEAKLDLTVVGRTPEGLVILVKADGTIREGLLKGAKVEAMDYLLMSTTEVAFLEGGKTLSLGDVVVVEAVKAIARPPQGLKMPTLAQLSDPRYTWPDVDHQLIGFSLFRTGAPQFDELNKTIAQFEGKANLRDKVVEISTYSLE